MTAACRLLPAVLLVLLTAACAALPALDIGQSYRDQPLAAAPQYHGNAIRHDGRLMHAAVAIDPWTLDRLDSAERAELQRLNVIIGSEIGDAFASRPLKDAVPAAGRPKLFVGLPPDDGAVDFADLVPGPDGRLPAVLRTWYPSREWRRWVGEVLAREGADLLLLSWTGVSRQYPQQVNLRGDKALSIGTGHVVELPWLSALDRPVEIVQIAGLLIDRNGDVLRAGSEGLLVLPTPFSAGTLGLTRTVQASDLAQLPNRLRDDLPTRPPVWRVATANLVAQLTGRRERLQP
jgi:hypothetical protein